jgi:hypothetical protein
MLEWAKKYENELKEIQIDKMFDLSFQWAWIGCERQIILPSDKTDTHWFVSTIGGQVIGEMGYSPDRATKKAQHIFCAHYTNDNYYTFGKDLIQMFYDIFKKFHLNKVSYSVIIGNPAEKTWDKFTKKHGGRIVGIREKDVILQDGLLYDIKDYEIMAEKFFNSNTKAKKK